MSSNEQTASNSTPQRPATTSIENLCVSIAAASPTLMQDFSHKESQVLFSLSIPLKLLHHWYMHKAREVSYIELVNSRISGSAVRLARVDRLEKRLMERANKLAARVRAQRGRQRIRVTTGDYQLFVLEGEADSFQEVMDEMEAAKEQLTEREQHITSILQEMAESADHKEPVTPSSFQNRGRKVHEVSPRQLRRKLSQCKSFIEQALWFCDTFGLQPEIVQLKKVHSGSPVKMTLQTQTLEEDSSPSPTDTMKVQQALYILDRFAVSDEAYHELSTTSNLPPLYRIKQARLALNESLDIRQLQGSHPGAFRPLKEAIQKEVAKIVQNGKQVIQPIKVKLSGDGAKFTRSSNIILFSFSFPELQDNVLSGMGNHTFASLKCEESYEDIVSGLSEVLDEVNSLIANPVITVDETSYSIDFFLGSDYKFLLLMMGLNQATSKYSCVWCTINKDDRWDMSVDASEYVVVKARTFKSLKTNAHLPKNRPVSEILGSKHPPLLNIEPDHIVPDELHLLLRIADVLIRNLINSIVTSTRLQRRGKAHTQTYLEKLEEAARECGVTFKVWEAKDPDGKSSGKYEWTSIMGNDVKKLFQSLPAKFANFLAEDIQAKMAQIWTEFFSLYKDLSSWSPLPSETIQQKAKDWIRLFLSLKSKCQGFQQKNVTPYMHTMVYHVPYFIKKYGNIKMFSGQGVEKNNDDARRNYFSSNLHDPVGEVLKAEGRMDHTSLFKRKKRKYTRQTPLSDSTNKTLRLAESS